MKSFLIFKPAFGSKPSASSGSADINFARKWRLIVLFTSLMALLPLLVMTLVEFGLTRSIIEAEARQNMLRTLDTASKSLFLSGAEPSTAIELAIRSSTGSSHDMFIIDHSGTLLTPSFYFGSAGLVPSGLFSEQAGVEDTAALSGEPVFAGYQQIPGTDMTFVIARSKNQLTDLYFTPRLKLVGYLVVSIALILLSIMGMATFLVRRIHAADRKRIAVLRHAEYANKLASIGRLASGVAHEINNPLAIINQKTGLMLDLVTLNRNEEETPEDYRASEERIVDLGNDVLAAVQRCGTITRQLLDFARNLEPCIEPLDIRDVIDQVLAFLNPEANRRNLDIDIIHRADIKRFESDRGCLQQIFLNLFENAFTAMEDCGRLEVRITNQDMDHLMIRVSDNGKGIPEEDLDKIFEPFFTSATGRWGTGHGLSITYGLVKEIGGDIRVKSRLGKGTTFVLILPMRPPLKSESGPEPFST